MAATMAKELAAARKVIVYRKELFRVPETFIKAQVRSYQLWQAVLFGERIWPRGLLEGIESRTLMDGQPTFLERVFAKVRQTVGAAPASVMPKFKTEGAHLLHAHFGYDGILAWPYAHKLNVPLVATLHGHDVNVRPECYQAGEYGFWQKRYPDQFAGLARQRDVHFIARRTAGQLLEREARIRG
jgi:hypothetical protein